MNKRVKPNQYQILIKFRTIQIKSFDLASSKLLTL